MAENLIQKEAQTKDGGEEKIFDSQEILLNLNESIGKPEIMASDLTLKQEKFCQLYTQNSECFGNGTLSYADAYGYNLDILSKETEVDSDTGKRIHDSDYQRAYDQCSALASRLLRNEKINRRITDLLNELMTEEVADRELAYIMAQRYKLEPKLAAIKEFNKLKQRIVEKSEVDVTTQGKSLLEIIQNDNSSNAGTIKEQVLAATEPLFDQEQARTTGEDAIQQSPVALPPESNE